MRIAGFVVPALLFSVALTAGGEPAAAAKPKLLVLVVFDQLRGDFPVRWGDLFGDGGFRRLMDDGLWFSDCHYPYASTVTACGHASMLTGCSPDRHGIIGNEWFDRAAGKMITSIYDERAAIVGSLPVPAGMKPKSASGAAGPGRLLAETVGDVLKSEDPRSRVVALALKDRSAALPGGKRPDACYWFDTRTGGFITSTYYRDAVHDWVDRFNAGRPADRWLGATWDRLRADVDYTARSGPDDFFAEGGGLGGKLGRVFPHVLANETGKRYYDEVTGTPFGNDLLLDFALTAVREVGLGRGPATDLLCVSFSSNDLVGHPYGPDSHEVLDITLRSDRTVKQLLDALDAAVGKGRYVVALSSDHGICPIPEFSAAKGIPAERKHPNALREALEEFLNTRYGTAGETAPWREGDAFPWVYFNHRKIEGRRLSVADVAQAAAEFFRAQPYVAAAYTRGDLSDANNGGAFTKELKKAYHAGRAGDLAIVLKPYSLSTEYATGTTHGSPHGYDTHVPLMFLGPGLPTGRCPERVTPQAIAAVFARSAGVRPPAAAEAPLPARCAAN
jgi:hypothetical protein